MSCRSVTPETGSWLRSRTFLARCAWYDVISHPIPIGMSTLGLYTLGQLAWPFHPAVSVALHSLAHRILQPLGGKGFGFAWMNRRVERALARACREDGPCFSPAGPSEECSTLALNAGLVLKAPRIDDGGVREKGVLLLKFNHRIVAFHRSVDMAALLRHYVLVLEPSWSGYARPDFLAFTRYRDQAIVVLAPFQGDRQLLDALATNLVPLELGSGDWVNPNLFRPLTGEPKRFDAVMIIRWSASKRLDLLMRALNEISDPTFRVALVVTSDPGDRNRQGALHALERSGLRSQFEIFENIPPEEVNRVLNQSKVNVLLSRREGGNRGLFEGFFAGTPGMVLRNHVGVRTEHFRPDTGRLIDRRNLARELLHFRSHWSEFDPRPWALANIAPEVSTRRLNEFCKAQLKNVGEPWTADIRMKSNCPGLRYYPDDSAGLGLPTMADLLAQFPVR